MATSAWPVGAEVLHVWNLGPFFTGLSGAMVPMLRRYDATAEYVPVESVTVAEYAGVTGVYKFRYTPGTAGTWKLKLTHAGSGFERWYEDIVE